jgi:hypothetical protein
MANGHRLVRPADLVRHAAYQRDLLTLMTSLTEEGPDGRLREAKDDKAAFDAIVKFRRAYGLKVLDDDPNCQPLFYVIAMHRAIIRHPHFTKLAQAEPVTADVMKARAIINYSEHWLIRRGESCDVDTEFNPKPEKADGATDGRRRTAEGGS